MFVGSQITISCLLCFLDIWREIFFEWISNVCWIFLLNLEWLLNIAVMITCQAMIVCHYEEGNIFDINLNDYAMHRSTEVYYSLQNVCLLFTFGVMMAGLMINSRDILLLNFLKCLYNFKFWSHFIFMHCQVLFCF